MSLEKQIVPVLLGQGVDQKTDKKTLATKFSELKNAYLNKTNRLDKRFGSKILSNSTQTGLKLTNGRALATFQNELLQQSDNRLYSWSPSQDTWLDRGPSYSVAVATDQIVNKTKNILQCDSAETLDSRLVAYLEDFDGNPLNVTLRWTLIDKKSGAILIADKQQDDTGCKNVRCLAFGNFFYIFYLDDASHLLGCIINPLTGAVMNTLNIATDNTAAGIYDVLNFSDKRIAFLYGRTANMRFLWLDLNLNQLTGVLAPFTISEVGTVLGLGPAGNATIAIAWWNATAGTRAAIINQGGSYLKAPFTGDADTAAVNTITVAGWVFDYQGAQKQVVQVFYEKTAASPGNTFVKYFRFDLVSTATPTLFLGSVGLATKAFIYDETMAVNALGDGIFVGVMHSSALQATLFVVNQDGVVISKHQPSTSGPLSLLNMLSTVSQLNDRFFFAMLYKTKLVSETGKVFSNLGAAVTSIDFKANTIFNAVEIGKNLIIVGGVPSIYDSISVVEQNFNLYPEDLSAAQSGSTGVPNGTYLYTAHYEWTDAKGQIQRSATAVPISVTVSGGPKNVSVDIPTLRLTRKTDRFFNNPRAQVSIVLSRTAQGDASTFYRSSSISAPTLNNVLTDKVTIVDTLTDSQLFSNEILYISGGVLDNAQMPACTILTIWQQRVLCAGLESSVAYAYSKIWTDGGPVDFAEGFSSAVDALGGGITAIEVLDDKLWIAKSDRYYIDFGDGPNDLGIGSFGGPTFRSSDAGVSDSQSVVRSPIGLFFKSRKGFYLVDSNLTNLPIGVNVQDYNGLVVSSATLIADINQVRFTTIDGVTLVYDYYYQQWGVYDFYEAYDSIIWQEQFMLLRTSGGVYSEDKSLYRDDGRSIQISATMGWLAFAGIGGFQRVYRFIFTGDYLSEHKLKVSVGYDGNEAWTDTYIFDPQSAFAPGVYGDGIYGEVTPYGGIQNSYIMEGHLSQQKCGSIRFKIEDLTPSSAKGSGQALNLTALSFEIGIKKGRNKLPTAQTVGSTGGE